MMSRKSYLFGLLGLLLPLCAAAYQAPVENRDVGWDDAASGYAPVLAEADNTQYYVQGKSREKALKAARQAVSHESSFPTNTALSKVARLQDEIRELHGQLELQSHEISELKQAQEQFYQELDKRLAGLSGGGHVSMQTEHALTPAPADKPTANQSSLVEASADEQQDLYQRAYQQLRGKHYSEASTILQDYVKRYPQGLYAANSHYWLGELALLTGQPKKAKTEFSIVAEQFKTSPKVADAMLKLGFIYADEGKAAKARGQLEKVKHQFPNTSPAKLAERRLQHL